MTELESAMLAYFREVKPMVSVRIGAPVCQGPRHEDDWSIEWDGNHPELSNEMNALADFWRRARAAHQEGAEHG